MNFKHRSEAAVSAILNSYSQIFFSDNRIFAGLLVMVSFFDLYSGLAGLLSVVVSNALAYFWGYNKSTIQKGLYGFNSLIIGIGLGMMYEPSFLLTTLVVVASVFTLFITVMMQGVLGKYYLPYLSWPFLLSIWMILLATNYFPSLNLSHRGLFKLNDMYSVGGISLIRVYDFFNFIRLPKGVVAYFSSLSAIFFQYNVIAGIFIALGLLIYSRIAFSLSVIGFYAAYVFYDMLGVDTTGLMYSYVGFNFILTSIAIGGYFIVPSKWSYLWVLFIIPVLTILTTALAVIWGTFHLNIYSMPFNVTVVLFLYAVKCRTRQLNEFAEVYIQQYSPEKNLYSFQNYKERFNTKFPVIIKLPFLGFWDVSQGHNGEYTHKDEWRHAWDFIINGPDGKQYRNNGDLPEDYYCYNKVVIAAAEGTVETIVDGIDDNIIGNMNVKDNWGNTIILKHKDDIYTKYCHLKKGSIKVRQGDTIKQGQVIAHCGSSGRSPYPHLHFQIQPTPYIGSRTTEYPLAYYLTGVNGNLMFHSFSLPAKDEKLSNIDSSSFLSSAFKFIPGKEYDIQYRERGTDHTDRWKIETNSFNYSYIECDKQKCRAYFYNDGHIHYFTHYEGNKRSILYYFFLSCYKIQLGLYPGLVIKDSLTLNSVFGKSLLLHDFIAPFKMLLSVQYESKIKTVDNEISPEHVTMQATTTTRFLNHTLQSIQSRLEIDATGIRKMQIITEKKTIEATCSIVY